MPVDTLRIARPSWTASRHLDVRNPADLNPVTLEPDCHDIHTPHPQAPGKRPDLMRLRLVEGLDGVDAIITVEDGRLHLDGNASSPVLGEDVDLSAPYSQIAIDDSEPVASQECCGGQLSDRSHVPSGQSRTPGSSSSMFTSRNVNTRTRWRNLAGRYMSHTHASSSSISK